MFSKSNLISLNTIVKKEIVRFLRIWSQTLLPPVITQSLYFVIFGTFLGSRLDGINGVSFVGFIVPGIIMMAVITASFSNVVSSFFGSKFQRNIEEIMVSPTPSWVIVLGFCLGGVLRGTIVGILVFLVSIFFVKPEVDNIFIVLAFTIVTAMLFSIGGLLNGLLAKKFDDVTIFPTFVLVPLTYLGGVFQPIESLPEFWRNFSLFNPIVYMVDGFRAGFFGFSSFNVWYSFVGILIVTLLLFALSVYLIKKGIGLRA
jgi:ABC-2 type transport system permease protein